MVSHDIHLTWVCFTSESVEEAVSAELTLLGSFSDIHSIFCLCLQKLTSVWYLKTILFILVAEGAICQQKDEMATLSSWCNSGNLRYYFKNNLMNPSTNEAPPLPTVKNPTKWCVVRKFWTLSHVWSHAKRHYFPSQPYSTGRFPRSLAHRTDCIFCVRRSFQSKYWLTILFKAFWRDLSSSVYLLHKTLCTRPSFLENFCTWSTAY
jgi:hypothetical protein